MKMLRHFAIILTISALLGCQSEPKSLAGEWSGIAPSGVKAVFYLGKDGTAKLTMGNRAVDAQMLPGTTLTWTHNSKTTPKELDFKASDGEMHVVIPMIYNQLTDDRIAVRMGNMVIVEQEKPIRPSWREGDPSVFMNLVLDRTTP